MEIDERDPQNEKQPKPRISTVRGITIDFSEELRNAANSISLTGNSRPMHAITQRRQIRSSPQKPIANASGFDRQYRAHLIGNC
jgi:hypothetical protein